VESIHPCFSLASNIDCRQHLANRLAFWGSKADTQPLNRFSGARGTMFQSFDLWNFLGGLIAGGIGGSFLTLNFSKKLQTNGSGNTVDQSNAKAGRDITGRDKK